MIETMAAIRRWARHQAQRHGLDREELEGQAMLAYAGVLHRHDPQRCPHVDALLWPRLRGLLADERRRAARQARRRPPLEPWAPPDPLTWAAVQHWHDRLVPRQREIVDALPAPPIATDRSAATVSRRRARLHRSLDRIHAGLARQLP